MRENLTRVAFVTSVLPDYKVHLFNAMARLPGHEVMVWHGPHTPDTTPVDVDPGDAFPHRSARNFHFRLGIPLVWQRVSDEVWRFDPHVLVLEDGVRILSNLLLIAQAERRSVPVIFYAHGENLQRGLNRGRLVGALIERARQVLHRRARSLVVYTEESARVLRSRAPGRSIHVANNTLDTAAIRSQIAALPEGHRERTRNELGVPDGTLLVASVGRLVREHDPRPAIDGVLAARRAGADCHLLLIGSGPLDALVDAHLAKLAPAERSAIHRMSRQPIEATTDLLAASDLFLAPGTIGLSIVHAFAAKLPFIGGDSEFHGPEKDYLVHDVNGLRVRDYGAELVAALLRLQRDPDLRRRLATNADQFAREHLSTEAQVRGFSDAFAEATLSSRKRPNRATASEARGAI